MKLEKITDKIVYNESTISKRMLFNTGKVLNFMLNLKPGQGVPPHNHENSDMIIYVVSGDEAEVVTDGNTTMVTQGDVFHCEGKEMFSMTNTGKENLSCFVVLTPNPSQIYSKEF